MTVRVPNPDSVVHVGPRGVARAVHFTIFTPTPTPTTHAFPPPDDDDSDDSEESEGEGESGEKASSPEAEPRSAGFGFIVPDDNGDQADGKATDGEAAKHDDHAHEKKVPGSTSVFSSGGQTLAFLTHSLGRYCRESRVRCARRSSGIPRLRSSRRANPRTPTARRRPRTAPASGTTSTPAAQPSGTRATAPSRATATRASPARAGDGCAAQPTQAPANSGTSTTTSCTRSPLVSCRVPLYLIGWHAAGV